LSRAADGPLPDDPALLQQMIRELLATLAAKERDLERLRHQYHLLVQRLYGKRSERFDPNQPSLFEEAEPGAQAAPAEENEQGPSQRPAERNPTHRNGHGRGRLPDHLPRREVVHDLTEAEKLCPDCGCERRRIGQEQSEQLEYVPASLVVLQHVRPTYACPCCQGNVATAAMPPQPIERGLPGPGLLAHVVVAKYADHLPLHRQEGMFGRQGVSLSRKTLCDWTAAAASLLEPIALRMKKLLLESKAVQADETVVPVLDEEAKATKKGRLWVYLGDRDHPYNVFDYTPDRKGVGPENFLTGYEGFLVADAYSGYDALFGTGRIVEVGCWSHARRHFYEARNADPLRSAEALARIGRLFGAEPKKSDLDGLTAEESDELRLRMRREKSKPEAEAFFAWCSVHAKEVLPKSPMGEAFTYALRQQAALERYLEHGFLPPDNNASERALRTVAIGRKNWLFAGNDAGGVKAATLYSILSTCKRHDVNPEAYLKDVLDLVSTHPAAKIDDLLPDRWKPACSPGS
jgi:transposase